MKFRFIVFILPLLLTSCDGCKNSTQPKTELEKLPAATQVGKNTFGCLVNGKAWVMQTSDDAVAYYQAEYLLIGADILTLNQSKMRMAMRLSGDYVVQKQNFDLTNIPHAGVTFMNWGNNQTCFYDNENTIHGTLTITEFNQKKRIISGTFDFTTVVSDCDSIQITDGRFDLAYVY